MLLKLFILAFLGAVSAQKSASCNNTIETVHSFKKEEIIGEWYQYSRSSFRLTNQYKCGTNTFNMNNDGTIAMITFYKMNSGDDLEYNGTLSATSDGYQNGKMTVSYPDRFGNSTTFPYWFLDTDYSNYAITYSCSNGNANVWILTRAAEPTNNVVKAAEQALQNRGITLKMNKIEQNCRENVGTSTKQPTE